MSLLGQVETSHARTHFCRASFILNIGAMLVVQPLLFVLCTWSVELRQCCNMWLWLFASIFFKCTHVSCIKYIYIVEHVSPWLVFRFKPVMVQLRDLQTELFISHE